MGKFLDTNKDLIFAGYTFVIFILAFVVVEISFALLTVVMNAIIYFVVISPWLKTGIKKLIFKQNKSFQFEKPEGMNFGNMAEKFKEIKQNVMEMFPPKSLFNRNEIVLDSDNTVNTMGKKFVDSFAKFGVNVTFVGATRGISTTQYLFKPGQKVRVVKGVEVVDPVTIKMIEGNLGNVKNDTGISSLSFAPVIEGTQNFGLEIRSNQKNILTMGNIFESTEVLTQLKELTITIGDFSFVNGVLLLLGMMPNGKPLTLELTKVAHLLLAGATGSGKSIANHALLASLLATHTPKTLKLLLADPKRVELSQYAGIPHLLRPIIKDVDGLTSALTWAVAEMERRYVLLESAKKRDIQSYNANLSDPEKIIPFIVIMIDEFADLILTAQDDEIETAIIKLGQKARSSGIFCCLTTQRPDKDVVTGLIKSNVPNRVAFAVSSKVNSQIILDAPGAELITNKGQGILLTEGILKPFQGVFVSTQEVDSITGWWEKKAKVETAK